MRAWRQRMAAAALIFWVIVCSDGAARAQKSEGTVNIILANKNGLVAVTDSMLTYTNGTHSPTGIKLYQIDDRTICTMAGLYTQSGPSGQNELLDQFFVRVPSLMNYYKSSMAKSKSSFIEKYEVLIKIFSHDLTTNVQALESKHPLGKLDSYGIELTIAGYDDDGKLKLAAVRLKPVRDEGGIHYISSPLPRMKASPQCESAGTSDDSSMRELFPEAGVELPSAPRIIGEAFVCEVAGITDVASAMLANPADYRAFPALGVFALKSASGVDLTITELRGLALALEEQTAQHEQLIGRNYVGGEAEVAVLSSGRLTEEPKPNAASPEIGPALHEPQTHGGLVSCDPRVVLWYNQLMQIEGGSQQQADLTDCNVLLDGVLFHDSTFTRGIVEYDGGTPLTFPDTNKVHDSTLRIGHNVDLDEPGVKHLICDFPWRVVLRNLAEQPNFPQVRPDWVVMTPACRTAWNVEHGFGLPN